MLQYYSDEAMLECQIKAWGGSHMDDAEISYSRLNPRSMPSSGHLHDICIVHVGRGAVHVLLFLGADGPDHGVWNLLCSGKWPIQSRGVFRLWPCIFQDCLSLLFGTWYAKILGLQVLHSFPSFCLSNSGDATRFVILCKVLRPHFASHAPVPDLFRTRCA